MVCCALMAASASARVPELLRSRDLQGPVRAAGGELIFLAGARLEPDDPIYFRPLGGGTEWRAEKVGAADANGIIVRVPAEVDTSRAWTIEVAPANGPRSGAAWVNDARPSWFLPRTLPVTGAPAGLERELRIVGRNLAPTGNGATAVRLIGPRTLDLASSAPPELREFVVQARVPDALAPGDYRVQVARDGRTWVALETTLRIEPAVVAQAFDVGDARFGGCHPDDARDDSPCLVAALAAAARVSNAEVHFGAGTWNLEAAAPSAGVDGFIIPAGVSLVGAPDHATQLLAAAAGTSAATTLFTLTARSRIEGLVFAERDRGADLTFLRLGRSWNASDADTAQVRDITITGNRFRGRSTAIADGGVAIRGLVITHNVLRARRLALELGGDARNPRVFRIEDATIAHNQFEPGSYLDVPNHQGAIASELGAGERVDFSDNVADGAATGGLDAPGDARGWRAAFFWHLLGPQERVLIARNDIRCAGDKAGDGEAIALDNNHNTFALDGARIVDAADRTSVTLPGPLTDPARDYRGHWAQIVDGPGVGQSRRIVDIASANGDRPIVRVEPAWDVVPEPRTSRIVIGRTFWQAMVVGNLIDERAPRCQHSNRTKPQGGVISIWANTTDSVVAFNRQSGTNGIVFQQIDTSIHQYFLELRGNQIDGVYDAKRGFAGITGSHGAAPDRDPPIASFGPTIANNRISLGAGATQAAISMPPTWYRGPAPYRWPLIDRPLIFGNQLTRAARGVDIPKESLVRNAVLFENRCSDVPCPSREQTGSCECR